jgi:AAA15 family ATPase/GTPase
MSIKDNFYEIAVIIGITGPHASGKTCLLQALTYGLRNIPFFILKREYPCHMNHFMAWKNYLQNSILSPNFQHEPRYFPEKYIVYNLLFDSVTSVVIPV